MPLCLLCPQLSQQPPPPSPPPHLPQCVELDFQYPSEGIHRRWDAGYRITSCAATPDQAAFVLRCGSAAQVGKSGCSGWRCLAVLILSPPTAASLISFRLLTHTPPRSPPAAPQRAQAAADGRDAGDAAHQRLPQHARQGEVGQEPVHRGGGLRPHSQLARRCDTRRGRRAAAPLAPSSCTCLYTLPAVLRPAP